jgi:PAS domain S-box-containing protein
MNKGQGTAIAYLSFMNKEKESLTKDIQASKSILENKTKIFDLWVNRVRQAVPASKSVSTPVLINSLPNFLDHISNALNNTQEVRPVLIEDATKHASERAQIPNYTLEQVLFEYRLLRQTLIESLSEGDLLPKSVVLKIDNAIDEGISKAAKEYLLSEIEFLQKKSGIKDDRGHDYKAGSPESRMAQSQEGLRLLIDSVKDYAIYMLNPDGIVISWNEGAKRISGYEAEEILGKHFSVFYSNEAKAQNHPEEELKEAKEKGKYEEQGWRYKKDGSKFWGNVIISPIKDRSGKFLGYAKVTRDLTEQLKKEKEIHRLNEELSKKLDERTCELNNIVESAGEGIYGIDDEGCLTFINRAGSKLLGWEPEEILGKRVHDLIHHSYSDGSRYPIEKCPIYTSLKDGINHYAEEDVFWRKDGTYFSSEYSSNPIFIDGKIVGAVIVFRNISERKEMYEAIKNQQEWLNIILDKLPVPVMLFEASSGDVRFMNEAARNSEFYIPKSIPDDLSNILLTDIAGKRLTKEEIPRFRISRGDAVKNFEMLWHTPKGVYHLLLNGGYLPAMFGQNAVAILTFEDITQRKIHEAKLKQAVNAREEVLGVVSHDLRNPLGAILMNANILKRQTPCTEVLTQHTTSKILRAGQRMNDMIEDLLNMAKIDSGKLELKKKEFCGLEQMSEAVEMLKPFADKKKIKIIKHEKGKPMLIHCDQSKILRVFSNLLHNAIKFTPEFGIVTLSSEEKEDCFLFSIADTGPGITKENLPHIFDRFWQSKTTAHLGTGLGLSIAKGIIEAHGGKIWAESEFGHGTTFFFTLSKK